MCKCVLFSFISCSAKKLNNSLSELFLQHKSGSVLKRNCITLQQGSISGVSLVITPDNFDKWSSHQIAFRLFRSDFF